MRDVVKVVDCKQLKGMMMIVTFSAGEKDYLMLRYLPAVHLNI